MTGTKAEKAEALGRQLHRTQPAPALSLAVSDAQGVIWSQAFGKADLEFDIPTTAATVFRIGSVSKVLTAAAAVKLSSKGIIDLQAPIFTWLPQLPKKHHGTTLLHLLTHRGGIRHYEQKDVDPQQPGGPVMSRISWTRDQILDIFVHDPLVSSVGGEVNYSSFGYSLVQVVLEEATGRPFRELIEAEVTEPLGLTSIVGDDLGQIISFRARGYVSAEEMRRLRAMFPDGNWPPMRGRWANTMSYNPAFCWSGAGYLANIPELARFGASMLDAPGSLLTADERSLLFTPLTERSQSSPPLGLAWRIDTDAKGRLRWHHAGATPGGRAGLIVYPELGLSIAIAGNVMTLPGDVLHPASDLADAFG